MSEWKGRDPISDRGQRVGCNSEGYCSITAIANGIASWNGGSRFVIPHGLGRLLLLFLSSMVGNLSWAHHSEAIVVIFLIHWRILPGREHLDAFMQKWKTGLRVNKPDGLIGEFLSSAKDASYFQYVTWPLDDISNEDVELARSIKFESFVNVGLWRSKEDFLENIGGYFPPDPKAMESFEAAPRRRALVEPEAWRLGNAKLPTSLSPGVLL